MAAQSGPVVTASGRAPRALHPVAWWLWAAGLATASMSTTNPLLLALVLAVLALVVTSRRTDAPWARAFRYYFLLAVGVVAIRVLLRSVFASPVSPGDHILLWLPQLPTPSWYAGVQIGGPVSLEATLSAVYDGLRLACLLCCLGAANALANPKRALRVLPGALYELGVAVVVAISVAPQLVESLQRVRLARRLRAEASGRWHGLRALVIPVVEDAFERSLRLAAAMDSRGYGRSSGLSASSRRITGGLMVTGMLSLCAGAYGLLDASAPRALGLPMLAAGSVLSVLALALGSRRVTTTSYRPDPWRLPEWVVASCGLIPGLLLSAGVGGAGLNPAVSPLQWPPLPLAAAAAIMLAAVAAVAAPPPVISRRRSTKAVPSTSARPARVAQAAR
jgi:energy-coupling factor transport system permease protein